MTSQENCRVLDAGRGDPTNNETGKPIARSTLWRYFRNELISDHSLLRAEIAGRWRAALKNGWAVEAGLRNKCGWDPGRYGGLIGSPDDGDINPTVQIEFVMPSGNRLPNSSTIARLIQPRSVCHHHRRESTPRSGYSRTAIPRHAGSRDVV